MIQNIGNKKLDNHYYPDRRPDKDSKLLVFRGGAPEKEVLIAKGTADDKVALPSFGDIQGISEDAAVYLFSIDEERFFLMPEDSIEISSDDSLVGFCKMKDLRRAGLGPQHYIFAIYTAFHLNEWYESSKYCGRCGKPTIHDKVERAKVCPHCHNRIYPRINPAVIIGVIDRENNKLLLTKYNRGFAQNALVAGFTEIGETLEETVKREVMEEVGLSVENIRYYKSQPWGIALDILTGFYCDVVGDRTIHMDESELKYAQWVAPEDVELQTTNYSLTNEMMRLFKEKNV